MHRPHIFQDKHKKNKKNEANSIYLTTQSASHFITYYVYNVGICVGVL